VQNATGGESLLYHVFPSPLGEFYIASAGKSLVYAGFDNPERYWSRRPMKKQVDGVLDLAQKELEAYFAGRLKTFSLPCSYQATPFREKVWQELTRIPYGETITYGELAERIGNPRACRAVGQANHFNPLSIIIPCHRVIGKGGALVGYGGGLDKKSWLLRFEKDTKLGEE
jgi:methylated-DNA-[protein]-cysteine S-methyltransferase